MKITKLLLSALMAVLAVTPALGQDLIVKRDAEKIEARVEEVTDTHVTYRRFSNPQGPVYSLSLLEVRMIDYENGERDEFHLTQAPATASDLQNLSGELSIRRNSVYTIGGTRLSRDQILQHTAPYQEVFRQITLGYRQKRSAIIVGCIGGGLLVNGLYMSAIWGETYGMPMVSVIVGSALGVASVGLGLASLNTQKKAMRLYNETAGYAGVPGSDMPGRDDVTLSLAPTLGGLGLQLKF